MDQLVAEGVPDFKLFTAYPGVFLSPDDHIFRALQQTAEERRPDPHARRERAGHRRDRRRPRRGRHHRPDRPRAGALPGPGGRGDEPGASAWPRPPASRSTSSTSRRATRWRPCRPPVAAGPWSSPRPARSTSSSRSTTSGNGFEGAKYVCSPPLRPKDHQEDLWRGLRTDDLQLVGTDHCPFDFDGQKELGRGDFRKIPNGLPAVEDRVDLLHHGGVVEGRFSRERWVEVMATNPAKLFGMYPQKGAIAVGSDADILVYDPNRKRTISAATHHMDVDYSIFEGFEVQGTSDVVMSRGTVLVRDGAVGRAGRPREVHPAQPGRLRPPARRREPRPGRRPGRAASAGRLRRPAPRRRRRPAAGDRRRDGRPQRWPPPRRGR